MEENPKVYGTFYGLLRIQKTQEYVFPILAFLVCPCRPPSKIFRGGKQRSVIPLSLIGKNFDKN